jgi:hypothetical protein
VRDREAEFARRDRSRDELLAAIDETRGVVRATLAALPERELDIDFVDAVAGVRFSNRDLLIHLACHLAYHLGQVDYHRRLLTGGGSIRAVPMQELASARPT